MAGFTERERSGVHKLIYARRDTRRFSDDPVSEETLARLLDTAHHAPSVGFSQPWDFVVVEDDETKAAVASTAERVIATAREGYREPRKSEFGRLKLEGTTGAPANVCVMCDPTRDASHALGRNTMQAMDTYSTCLAVQNLWLAARAEGVGIGWVPSPYPHGVREAFGIPHYVEPIAYLCVGYPEDGFPEELILQREGWRKCIDMSELVRWGEWESTSSRENWSRGATRRAVRNVVTMRGAEGEI